MATSLTSTTPQLSLSTGDLNNQDGTISSQQALQLSAGHINTTRSLIEANGDLNLTTSQALLHSGNLTAQGRLQLNALSLDNQQGAVIQGADTQITITGDFTNRGTVDGGNTWINALNLDNLGSGLILGDHLALQADSIRNLAERVNGVNKSAVLAARQRMDIGVGKLLNQDAALIFSGGDPYSLPSQRGGVGGTDHIPIVQTEPNATEGVRPPGQPDAALPIHTGIQTLVPGIFKLPSNSLFQTNPDSGSLYLVETNPRFTNYRNWMSSDYMFKQMSFDPAMTQKRLGDGFYEQKIIREQVAQLTGRRFLQGYASDEAQFEALMNNGLSHYQSLQLIPGVALTALQMARLTSDIVWLVQEDIVMPDGSTVKALVPRLYVMPQAQDLEPGLGMLAGNTVNIRTSADISNSGTIAGRQLVNLSADNIRNLGGNIQAKQVSMNALTDIINQGGSVKAKDAMRLHAGRDITLESTTNSSQHQQGASSFSRTNLNRVASLYVDGANASLDISAGRNLTLNASQIINTGENGKTSLSAGNDITLGTLTIAERNNGVINAKNYNKDASSRELGSSVQAKGDIRFSAGGDINMVAVDINSQAGVLSLNAGEDINITEGRSTREVSSSRSSKSKGFLSSKRSLNQFNYADDTAIASTLSAENISLQAGLTQPGKLMPLNLSKNLQKNME